MEKKYYVPEIEEFCVGFEYEVLNELNKNIGWRKEVLDDNDRETQNPFNDLNFHLQNKQLRVKHLDQEDIESLDWVYDVNYPFRKIDGDNTAGFSKAIGKFHYYRLILRGNKVLIYVSNPDGDEGLFRGIIKNKSELKVLLKQLGI